MDEPVAADSRPCSVEQFDDLFGVELLGELKEEGFVNGVVVGCHKVDNPYREGLAAGQSDVFRIDKAHDIVLAHRRVLPGSRARAAHGNLRTSHSDQLAQTAAEAPLPEPSLRTVDDVEHDVPGCVRRRACCRPSPCPGDALLGYAFGPLRGGHPMALARSWVTSTSMRSAARRVHRRLGP